MSNKEAHRVTLKVPYIYFCIPMAIDISILKKYLNSNFFFSLRTSRHKINSGFWLENDCFPAANPPANRVGSQLIKVQNMTQEELFKNKISFLSY